MAAPTEGQNIKKTLANGEPSTQDIRNLRSVYSHWGRFRDADESAYHEYICKRAGISVLSALAFDQGFA